MIYLQKFKESLVYKEFKYELFTCLIVLGLFIATVYLIIPLGSSCSNLFRELNSRKTTIKEAYSFDKNFKNLKMKNIQIEKNISSLKLKVAKDKRLSNIYEIINSASKSSKASVLNVDMLPEIRSSESVNINFNLKLNGTFNEIGLFAESLESSGFIVSINQAVLDYKYGKKVSAFLKISIHFFL